MRLLNVKSLEFTDFREGTQPKYVIASHRWVEGCEVTYQDVRKRRNTDKSGYKKIIAFAEYVREHVAPVEWLWVDTCCINKDSAAELSKSLNLMFDWYHDAVLCIAYLIDVKAAEDMVAFAQSEWFKRGWTLQELLAPRLLVFVTETWQVIGNKGASTYTDCGISSGLSLEQDIAAITGIPERVLCNFAASSTFSVEEKLKWMEGRTTTEPEDMSYALFGIFEVTPGANYGEKGTKARQRLLDAIHYQDVIAAQRADRFQQIAEWLSAPDPWTNHESTLERREPYTGTWLLESNEYQSWKFGRTSHLWVHGKAGCGKTILCSTAVEDIRTYCESVTNAGHAIFYFSFSDNQKQSYEGLVRSLAVQLGWKQPGLSILQQAYDQIPRKLPSANDLEKIVVSCIESYDVMFLSLDALDECPESGDIRQNVLSCLERLTRKLPKLRVLATSREVADVGELMETIDAVLVSTKTQCVDADIRKYTSSELRRQKKLQRLDPATKMLIRDTISRNADGMFRWAYCQLQELKTLPSMRPKYVREILRSLPSTLDATYERMLMGIRQMFRPEALTLLYWLAYARSPPSLGELAEAAIINPKGEGCFEVGERGELEDTLNILSGLVIIYGVDTNDYDGNSIADDDAVSKRSESENGNIWSTQRNQRFNKDTKIRLAHYSVKEYLESKRILESEAREFYLESGIGHRCLAQSCLTYLIHYSQSEEKLSTTEDLTAFPLLYYAARSWFYHSSLQQPREPVHEKSLVCSEDAMQDWLNVYQPDRPRRDPFGGLKNEGSGLYYASCVGLEALVGELLRDGADVHAQAGMFGTALHAASYGGDEKLVRMLMDAGADVHAQAGMYGTVLQAASFRGHEKVVQMLMDAGANVNAQAGTCGTALQAASFEGYGKVMKMLMDAGADINAQAAHYSTALQAASFRGHEKVVQMLIDAGADINAQAGMHGTALQAASRGGYEKVVQILMDAEADINAQAGYCGTALQAASFGGHEKVVQILVDAGADINAHAGMYGTALQAASFRGYERVVQMLMDSGADFHAQSSSNALQVAYEGRHEIVMLEDWRGKSYIEAGHYGTALQAASFGGHEKVVQMLMDAGANVNAQAGMYGTALQAASFEGHGKVIKMLMDAGADVHAQSYGTTLHAVTKERHERIVQILKHREPEAHIKAGYYGTALQAASFRGYEKVVQVLIDAGPDINAQAGMHGTALQAASRGGHEKVVQMLMDAGADINAQPGEYGTALQAASRGGHEKVVQMLINAGALGSDEHTLDISRPGTA